jgi:hypothetical protein
MREDSSPVTRAGKPEPLTTPERPHPDDRPQPRRPVQVRTSFRRLPRTPTPEPAATSR